MIRIITAVSALVLGAGPAMAETGTLALGRADLNCFRVYISETQNAYAVDYASITTRAAAMAATGLISMFVDYAFWSIVTIETDNTQVDCGDGIFARVTGIHF